MPISLPTRTNAIWIQNVMCLMDGAIRCAELELFLDDSRRTEKRIQWAKRAYADAMRFAGRVSFNAKEVSVFESKSIRLERIIGKLQARHSAWLELSDRAADVPRSSGGTII